MYSLPQRVSDGLIRWRWPLLVAAILLAAAAAVPASRLRLSRSIEAVFAPDDPALVVYRKLRRTFQDNQLVLAVYDDPQLLAPDGRGIRRLEGVRRRLGQLPGVAFTLGLDQPLGTSVADPDSPLARRVREVLQGYTHGPDGRTAAVICVLQPETEAAVTQEETVAAIRRVIRRQPRGMATGEPVMVADGFAYIERDGRWLGWATAILMSIVILLCFRSLRWVIVALAVVQWAVLLTRAAIVWCGKELTLVSSMFTANVTVIGIASVVHVVVRYRQRRTAGSGAEESLRTAGRQLAAPIFWSVMTDAAAFSALGLSPVAPVRDFGLMMALGAWMVLAAVALLVPGLALAVPGDRPPGEAAGEKRLGQWLERLATWSARRPVRIATVAAAVVGAAFWGAFQLEVETDFTRNFRADSPLVRAYQYVEDHLGGAGVWDVLIPAPAQPDWPFLRQVLELEERLRREVTVPGRQGQPVPGLTKVFSLADIVRAGSPVDLDRIGSSVVQNALLHAGLNRLRQQMPGLVELLYGEDRGQPGRFYCRVMLRARERQPAAHKRQIIRQVERIVADQFPERGQAPGGEVGGFFVLLAQLVESVLRDQWVTFAASAAGIGLMMLLAFRSPALALVALVPNALPILAVTGLLGWSRLLAPEVRINMGAAMIAAVSMGLSIDSTIHYLFAVRYACAQGHSVREAIHQVQQNVGRAVVLSTIALVAGFLTLAGSQFVPTVYFGVLLSVTMLGGLAANLVVLPALLPWALRDRRRRAPRGEDGLG